MQVWDFGLYWGCLEARFEFLCFILSIKVERLPMWSLMTWIAHTLRIIEKNIFHIVHTFAPVCAHVRTFAYRWICRRADIRKFFVPYLQFGWSKAQSFFDHELRREVLKVTLLFSFLLTKWFFCLISSCFEIFW